MLSEDKWLSIRELALGPLGVKPETFKKWRQRRVPPDWYFPLLDAARERGVDLSREDLEATSDQAAA